VRHYTNWRLLGVARVGFATFGFATFGLAILLAGRASALEFDFAPEARPAPKNIIETFFSGRSWLWPNCNGCGAYFDPAGLFVAISQEKGLLKVGRGSWEASDGKLCWNATWTYRGGSDPKTVHCKELKVGPSNDGRYKSVLAIKFERSDGYFWIAEDKEILRDFVSGDRLSKIAAKTEQLQSQP
jgi:hypothetical protein